MDAARREKERHCKNPAPASGYFIPEQEFCYIVISNCRKLTK